MEYAVEVENLSKAFRTFKLDNVSFSLPKGYIMGFIGSNGAGKSTTLKSMLNIIKRDGGSVKFFGKDLEEEEFKIKQDIGLMLGPVDFYPKFKIKRIVSAYSEFFINWDEKVFNSLLDRFNISVNARVCDLSTGMKVKLGLALALSHHAKLLILDEPTSGLDPVARDELLDLFHEIVEDGEKSILFSSHITSDLDKCADFIIFIKNGKLIANSTKDEIIASHALVSGKKSGLTGKLKARLISYKCNSYGFTGMIKRENILKSDSFQIEKPTLEDVMIYYNKEGDHEKIEY